MKRDLSGKLGLPIELDLENFSLRFKDSLPQVVPAARLLKDMKAVILDKNIKSPDELYYMYRDVAFPEDRKTIMKNQLRYDITVIKPDRLGKEFMKTQGHYHPGNYPELYEVVSGDAWCLLQRPSETDFRKIIDIILVKAKAGEKIVCLPNYGHILINPSATEPLVTSNWVGTRFASDYKLYLQANGAAVFFTEEDGKAKQTKNNFFEVVPEIKIRYPSAEIKEFGLKTNSPIYPLVKNNVEALKFLNDFKKFDFSNCFVS